MSGKKRSDSSIFDIWRKNQQQLLDAQAAWLNPPQPPRNPFLDPEVLDRGLQSWQKCEEQYRHWTQAAQNWMGQQPAQQPAEMATQALNYLINPATFMQSGFELLGQTFSKLVNGPEFADIGMLEKKVLKSGADWQAFRAAAQRFQQVISDAWLRAYQHFSEKFTEREEQADSNPEALLQQWLKIADEELVSTLRSPEFLEAQRDFFAAGSAYRLRYREFVELWCESHTLPTRSEVDDLHRIVHELRREVRQLKKQLARRSGKEGT